MVEVPGGTDQQALAGVPALHEVDEGVPIERPHRLFRAEDGAAQGMVLPEGLIEQIMDQVVGRILHHVDFLQNDPPLLFDLIQIE